MSENRKRKQKIIANQSVNAGTDHQCYKICQWRIQDSPEEAAKPEVGANLLFGIIFADNYMKMKKKIGLKGHAGPSTHICHCRVDKPNWTKYETKSNDFTGVIYSKVTFLRKLTFTNFITEKFLKLK